MISRPRRLFLLLWIIIGASLIILVWAAFPGDENGVGEQAPPAASTTPASSPTTAPTPTNAPTTSIPSSTTAPPVTTLPPDQQSVPTDATSLAAELTEAERMIRSVVDPNEVAPWGRRQQHLYRTLSANPGWSADVLAATPSDVVQAVENNWLARQNLSALVNSVALSTTLPAWRISDPLPAAELVSYYKEAEGLTGIPWEYLAAINLVETRMGRIEGLSTAGAVGPMQFLPSTWDECCKGDPADDRDAIMGAAVYLDLTGGPEDMARAVKAYNRSDRYVNAVEAYVRVLSDDETAYSGYHSWQVYFLSSAGLILMPTGYEETQPVDVVTWLESNPTALVSS